MALFKDPIGSVTFELPAGWACDMLYSTMTDFFFSRWDRPEEMLIVHLRRTTADSKMSDERWMEKIQIEVGGQTPLFDLDVPKGRAVAADFVSKEGLTQRVAFLRGPFVDIAVEQRNADMESGDPWHALSRVVRTVVSGANRIQSGSAGPAEFNKTIEAANEAFERKDYKKVVDALNDAVRIGTAAWLFSLTLSAGSPEIAAAVRVAQAMAHISRFNGDPFLTRDAASILRRSLCSLESAGKAALESAQDLVTELKEVLDGIQSELLEKVDPDSNQDSAPIVSIRERGFRLAQAAATAFDADDHESALVYAIAAVEDILFLLVYFRRGRAQQIPDILLKHLVEQGISDHEEQRDAIQKVREGVLFPALNLALQIRYCCALERKDPAGAAEAVELYLPLARQIAAANPGDTGITLNLVLALISEAGVIAAHQDKEEMQSADAHLKEASEILDGLKDEKCPINGWIRNHKKQLDQSILAAEQWLAAVKGTGDHALESGLQSLHSAFEKLAKDLQEKIVQPAEAAEDKNIR